jgi:hypothetical protein
MALWRCEGCTTLYAVGLSHCPRCRGTTFHEEGQRVPKISRHGGASNKTLPATPDAVVQTEEPLTGEQAEELREAVEAGAQSLPFGATVQPTAPEEEGGEESSPGSSSSASSAKPPTSSEPSKPARRKPARGTGSRSAKARTESSSARLTVGEKTDPTSGPDSD